MGFGDWFRGLAWDKLSAALEFRRRRAVGKAGEGEGKGNGMGEHACGLLCLEACISLLQTGILGQVSLEGFSRTVISSPGVPFQGHGLY